MTAESDRIVIVGAGPVGLTAALRLARFGIPSVVLEASTGFPRDLRASTVHPPTLDMLDELDVAAPYIAQGVTTRYWQIIDLADGDRAVFDLAALEGYTAHPYRLQCEQFKLTPLLHEKAAATGLVEVHFGTAVTAIAQDGDGATAIAESGGETRRFRGRYLVGADGSRSVVRQGLGLPLEGETYSAATVLITTPYRFEDHMPELVGANYVWTRADIGSLFRLRDEWRCTFYPRPGEDSDEELSDEAIEERLQVIWPKPEPYEVWERRTYRVHQRIVPDYRRGRIVLAGDAAHLNAPTGGLGMNGGIHDAFNLSEKLARIMKGESDRLLDLYTAQRRPVAAEEIIGQSHKNRLRMQEPDPAQRKQMLRDMRALAEDPARAVPYLLQTSMIEGLRQAQTIA